MSTSAEIHIPSVLQALKRYGYPYRIVAAQSPEDKRAVEWVERNFQFSYMQIDWTNVPIRICMKWSEIEDLVESFKKLLNSLSSSSVVLVMWSNALCPSLEMTLGDIEKLSSATWLAQC